MKNTISKGQFIDGFTGGYSNKFTYEGKVALFEYLTELEDDMGEEFEYDPIGLCCEYAEYSELGEFQIDYGEEYEDMDAVNDATIVIPVGTGDSFIIQQF